MAEHGAALAEEGPAAVPGGAVPGGAVPSEALHGPARRWRGSCRWRKRRVQRLPSGGASGGLGGEAFVGGPERKSWRRRSQKPTARVAITGNSGNSSKPNGNGGGGDLVLPAAGGGGLSCCRCRC